MDIRKSKMSVPTTLRIRSRKDVHVSKPLSSIYQCGKCQFATKYEMNLNRHVKTFHGEVKTPKSNTGKCFAKNKSKHVSKKESKCTAINKRNSKTHINNEN